MALPITDDNATQARGATSVPSGRGHVLPVLLTVRETAELLRTTHRAVYVMIERHQLPGLTRIGRRVLFRADDLLNWLDQRRAPSSKE